MILSWWKTIEECCPLCYFPSPAEEQFARALMDYLGVTLCSDDGEPKPAVPASKRKKPTYLRVREIKDGYIKERNESEPGSIGVQAMQRYDAIADAVERLLEVLSEE